MPGNNYTLTLMAQINATKIEEYLKAPHTMNINAVISGLQTPSPVPLPSPIPSPLPSSTAAEGAAKMNAAYEQLNITRGQYIKTSVTMDAATNQITKAMALQKTGTTELEKTNINLSKSTGEVRTQITQTTDSTKSLTSVLGNAFEKIMLWAVATGAVYGALRALKEGVQYIKDLNVEMTNIQMVTGYTDTQVKNLALSYNRLAGELGATTLEVAQGSLEWFRQGKTVEEAARLTQDSIMMSKLANLSAAESTTLLTATLNGFKMSAEEAGDVISKLVGIDNAFATSVGEIATALQYSAAVAQQAGVTFDELSAYIKN